MSPCTSAWNMFVVPPSGGVARGPPSGGTTSENMGNRIFTAALLARADCGRVTAIPLEEYMDHLPQHRNEFFFFLDEDLMVGQYCIRWMSRNAAVLLALAAWTAAAADFPQFEPREIDSHVADACCYAVTLADVDGDKKIDIVAVTENKVVWYHNPDWKRRVIVEGQTERDNVCIAALDIDGDGKVDFALGAGWLNNKNLG